MGNLGLRELPDIPEMACNRFIISKTRERWEFRPSPAHVRGQFVDPVIAVAFYLLCLGLSSFGVLSSLQHMLAESSSVSDAGGLLLYFTVVAICLGVLAYGLTDIARAWKFRMLPLIIEGSGRIFYGERLVCSAGAVQSISVVLLVGEEGYATSYSVRMQRASGGVVELPSPYFNEEFWVREQARSFADKLAKALGVEAVDC